jgi:hypothetical protein
MEFSDISLIIIPQILVIILCIALMMKFFKRDEEIRMLDLLKEKAKVSTPIRLQAYERLALLLERIHPRQLILRVQPDNLNVQTYLQLLSHTIRTEFEHNLSQQIYVSDALWAHIVHSRDDILVEISEYAKELPPHGPGNLLSQRILESLSNENKETVIWEVDKTLTLMRREIAKQF